MELRTRDYNWGKCFLPHDGFSKDVATGKSSEDVLKRLGWDVVPKSGTVQLGVEEGIRATRLVFPRLFIDKVKCERLIECLKRYQRRVNKQTDVPGSPLHNEFSHGADMLRYAAINVDRMTNENHYINYLDLEPEVLEEY
jgi:phage terminase large subunit